MNRAKISISIDRGLLDRIDVIASLREEARSTVIERALRNGVSDDERFVTEMEKPLTRALFRAAARPEVMAVLAKIAGEHMSAEEVARVHAGIEAQARKGRERGASKRVRGKLERG